MLFHHSSKPQHKKTSGATGMKNAHEIKPRLLWQNDSTSYKSACWYSLSLHRLLLELGNLYSKPPGFIWSVEARLLQNGQVISYDHQLIIRKQGPYLGQLQLGNSIHWTSPWQDLSLLQYTADSRLSPSHTIWLRPPLSMLWPVSPGHHICKKSIFIQ